MTIFSFLFPSERLDDGLFGALVVGLTGSDVEVKGARGFWNQKLIYKQAPFYYCTQ